MANKDKSKRKKGMNKRNTTTISCDESAREFIASEAKRTCRLQREILTEIIAAYRLHQKRYATVSKGQDIERKSAQELFQEIKNSIAKNIKRDDTTIAFIKAQESKILSPMSQKIDAWEALLNTIVQILQSYK